ncbi:MAG: GFA family protein [Hyphomicrobiaceae bacterium]|nr:MAG: GFA family protein [Hyphomicrobiaceae bacterium]
MSETHSGGCLCGGVQYVVTGPLRDVVNCHCGQCRRTHGHFAGYTEAPLADFKLNSSDSLKWYQSSPQARRGFCSICGASLFWVPEGGDHVWIAAGTLDPPTGLRTVAHTYVADAGDYYTIADGLKTYPRTHLTAAVDK